MVSWKNGRYSGLLKLLGQSSLVFHGISQGTPQSELTKRRGLSPSLHDLVELGPKLLDSRVSVGAGVIGGVLGNSEHPFGLVHGVLACEVLPRLEIHQSVAKPEQLAAVWQPSGAL